ncbi:MAG: site-2 protease family protein [Candidatus Tectomicrobia bacterium]|uniref:Site-2 protease family protein n=1 Tax=Tectimicrobiota bacterium TaxID=2528274 RepID=A0A938B035_UNCTE|nr:site-2 protease family protein [Candidatus Tectomicrobia bacterium]
MEIDALVLALGWYFVFLFSTTFHEAAHAWAAQRGGDLTAYAGGQVSLDPRPHIRREPWGMVILPLVSVLMFGWPFGFASTPYDPLWARRYPRRAAWMSLAGPAANLLLVLAAGVLLRSGLHLGYLEMPAQLRFTQLFTGATSSYWGSAAVLLSMVFTLNLILAVFNLLPVPPLDGSGAVLLFLREKYIEPYQNLLHHPLVYSLGILVAWQFFDPLFRPVLMAALRLLYA